MPLYEYRCTGCGERFEKMRKLSERADGPACPACGGDTELALSAPGRVSGVGAGAGASGGGCGPAGSGFT